MVGDVKMILIGRGESVLFLLDVTLERSYDVDNERKICEED